VKKLRWQLDERTLPKHPYRDSAIIYGSLATLVVAIAAATGGNVVKAVIVAAAVFLGATLYSWWRFRAKLQKQEGGKE
jgi:heme O synthase-like polyprenyltransferase